MLFYLYVFNYLRTWFSSQFCKFIAIKSSKCHVQLRKSSFLCFVYENKASANSAANLCCCCFCCGCWCSLFLGWSAAAPLNSAQCALYIFVMMVTRILTRFDGAAYPFYALKRPAGVFYLHSCCCHCHQHAACNCISVCVRVCQPVVSVCVWVFIVCLACVLC